MKKIFIALLAAVFTFSAQAKQDKELKANDANIIDATQKGWQIRIGAGYLLGGTAPLPIPAEIRAINKFNPGLNLSLEGSAQKTFNDTGWGLKFGVRFDTKGMTTDAKTKTYHMVMKADDAEVTGVFTGHVKTHVNNTYISVPLQATYAINKRWTVAAGVYGSYLLKGVFDGEAYDGYIRDQSVFGDNISIEDTMNVLVQYRSGAQMSYSLNAYSPYEGFKVYFTGTKGRMELEVVEAVYVNAGGDSVKEGVVNQKRITVYPLFKEPYDVEIPTGVGGHGGGDSVLLNDIFGTPAQDPLNRAAGYRDGAMSILTGIAANASISSGMPVSVMSLVDIAGYRKI